MMTRLHFQSDTGVRIPAVSETEMREVDRLAVEVFNLGILQMMENAGRNLAITAKEMLDQADDRVVVLAGSGGNGGGGICSVRHLLNHGITPSLILSRNAQGYRGAAGQQLSILQAAGYQPTTDNIAQTILEADLIIDSLLGYSLKDAPHGLTRELIDDANRSKSRILSLDLPSGIDATSGESPGQRIKPTKTLTLALPKTGLCSIEGDILCADIGIPLELYASMGIEVDPFFLDRYRVPIHPVINVD